MLMRCLTRYRLCSADRSSWLLLGFLALTVGQATVLHAATPRDELLRFVPENTGFCVIFQGLRTHWAALKASPLAEQLQRSPLAGALFNAEDFQKLAKVKTNLLDPLGLDWARLRDDVLGEALIFAYRPGPPGKPEQEQGLFLLRVQNARTLADLIERFNEKQKRAGMLKSLEERDHNGVKYFQRIDVKETSYYFVRGPILLLTTQEDILRQALDCDRALAPTAEPLLTARLRQLGVDDALLAFWFNPRAFDAFLKARADKSDPGNATTHNTVARYWQALDGLALSVALNKELSIRLAVRARLADLPDAMRRFLTEAACPSDLWRYFPDDALLASAGRYDVAALLEALNDFLPPKSREALSADLNHSLGATLGKNFRKDILPFLGPDWGVCLTVPDAQEKGWFPQLVVALRVAEGDRKSPVDKAMLSAVHFLAQLARITHNQQNPERPINLDRTEADQREIHYLTGGNVFPTSVQPAFALQKGYLLFASMPEVIRRFGVTHPPLSTPEGSVPLVRISVLAWRSFLKERREEILQSLTAKNETTRAEAAKRLDRLQAGLQFLDRIEIRQQTERDQVILSLVIVPAQALQR